MLLLSGILRKILKYPLSFTLFNDNIHLCFFPFASFFADHKCIVQSGEYIWNREFLKTELKS